MNLKNNGLGISFDNIGDDFSPKPINVSGYVIGANNNPLENVNIYALNNNNIGTITNPDGSFSLNDVDPNTIIVFQYQGNLLQYKASEITGTIFFNDVESLNEVIVTAPGTKKYNTELMLAGSLFAALALSKLFVSPPPKKVEL